jgi:hypothetical protein
MHEGGREVRTKEKLLLRRNFLIEELIKADSTYRPPSDYRPAKKHKKVYIPQKDYPGARPVHPFTSPCLSFFLVGIQKRLAGVKS